MNLRITLLNKVEIEQHHRTYLVSTIYDRKKGFVYRPAILEAYDSDLNAFKEVPIIGLSKEEMEEEIRIY